MKKTDIYEALNNVDPKFIDESAPGETGSDVPKPVVRSVKRFAAIAVAAAVLVVLAVGVVAVSLRNPPEVSPTGLQSGESAPNAESSVNSAASAPDNTSDPAVSDVPSQPVESGQPAESGDPPENSLDLPEDFDPWIRHDYSPGLKQRALATPALPSTVRYPYVVGLTAGEVQFLLNAEREYLKNIPAGYDFTGITAGINSFTAFTSRLALSGAGESNRVYSPLNMYFTLSELAEISGGNTRAQILGLLNAGDMSVLREDVNAYWNKTLIDNGVSKCISASSLWLNDDFKEQFNRSAVETLAEKYYASVFSGDMTSDEYNSLFAQWLSESTGGMLDGAGSQRFSPDTALAVAMTMQFSSQWESVFDETGISGVFRSPRGNVGCEYMRSVSNGDVAFGEKFTAVSRNLTNGNAMFILPDEGYTVEDLLADEQAVSLIAAGNVYGFYDGTEYKKSWDINGAEVDLTLPKFDVSSAMKTDELLGMFGLSDAVTPGKADFSGIISPAQVFVGGGDHCARVIVDETGVRAASYISVMLPAWGGPIDKVTLFFNRPFIFVVNCGSPVFVGVVNDPSGE